MPDLEKLQKVLGVSFKDSLLLRRALVHSSYINENPAETSGHNERLEFLGDAVLDFLVAERLYREYALDEGKMTRLRASLVRRETLARIAAGIELGDYLFLGRGEESTGGREKPPNLAGALEAVIAAVFLDGGMNAAGRLVRRLYSNVWMDVIGRGTVVDYKSMLQEVAQSRLQAAPVYRLVSETGPDHDKVFTIEVSIGGRTLASAAGRSKKMAETDAARLALGLLDKDFTE